MLPGAYQEPADFVAAGFADAVRTRALDVDLEFIAPDLPHLLDRTVLDNLRTQVVAPARAAGATSVWLGGISLGGFIALCYAERNPGDLDGLCLLAPYLGNRIITGEVARAGGLRAWQPAAARSDDEERRLWEFLKRLPHPTLAVELGIGRQDRFAHGHSLLGDVLPAASVGYADGGHDWPTWLALWSGFLDRLATKCGGQRDPLGVW